MKLDFEIAVDQQNNANDQTFEGFRTPVVYKIPYRRARTWPCGCAREQRYLAYKDSGCPPVPAGQPRPYLVNFWLSFAKSP